MLNEFFFNESFFFFACKNVQLIQLHPLEKDSMLLIVTTPYDSFLFIIELNILTQKVKFIVKYDIPTTVFKRVFCKTRIFMLIFSSLWCP